MSWVLTELLKTYIFQSNVYNQQHSSILARRIPWTEEPGRLQSTGRKELDMTEATEHSTFSLYTYIPALGISASWQGIKLMPPAVEQQNFNLLDCQGSP